MAAPIRRFRLTRRSLHSNRTMREADERAHHGVQPRGQVERISQIASNSNYENK